MHDIQKQRIKNSICEWHKEVFMLNLVCLAFELTEIQTFKQTELLFLPTYMHKLGIPFQE